MATSNNNNPVTWDDKTDYAALINKAVEAKDWEAAKGYEAQRNAKLAAMNAAGTNTNGYTTGYSCLAEEIPVQPGDKVVMGDTIGYAADSAIVESTLGSHVHFSVTHYDEPMDPEEFLSLGN